MRTICFLLLMSNWAVAAESSPRDLLFALAKGPVSMNGRQLSLAIPEYVLRCAEDEITHSSIVRHAVEELDPAQEPKEWVTALQKWEVAVKSLEHEHAIWCLQVCLCHPRLPVTIESVDALKRLKNSKAVPFLLTVAEYENANEPIDGSRNIVLYEGLADSIAEALSTLTGVLRSSDKDVFQPLAPDLPRWQKWAVEHPSNGA